MARQPTAEIEALVAECLRSSRGCRTWSSAVNDALADRARAARQARPRRGFAGRLVVIGDPDIALGDCRIEWADGGLIRDRATIEAAIDESQPLRRRPYAGLPAQPSGHLPELERSDMSDDSRSAPNLEESAVTPPDDPQAPTSRRGERTAADLEAVFDVPVHLGGARPHPHGRSPACSSGLGTVVELDRQVGEAVDIYVNDRLVARGEIVLVENRLGVTMTEIIKAERNDPSEPDGSRN